MSLSLTILIIAGILSLPAGLFVAYLVSQPRVRFLGLLGGLVGLVNGALVVFTRETEPVRLDAGEVHLDPQRG